VYKVCRREREKSGNHGDTGETEINAK